ncbi:alpha-lytic protease prodomain-containing protein [Streptosporangium sp. 'caverna']|uniref:alpha-lytic protease prodomain-containing protein n=1 Tax=Streptosporangium sp. 'caverna' TaxID=2202249 RepID=UPI000D7E72FB|nr:alpha-lytic protease prodomain-containing protein [Streptosporangium sp. 'caverna']AWS47238.1 serine protease [Streptosporangium sp. 'caverna']
MSRRHAATAGRVLAVAALVLVTIPIARSEAVAARLALSVWKPPPGMLAALQRDLHITVEQAQARLLNEARFAPIEAHLRRRLGDRFAGSWLIGSTSQILVVATTDSADLPQITATGARGEVVGRSLARLDATLKEVDAALATHPNGRVRLVDVRTNKVIVLSDAAPATEDFLEAAGVDLVAVRVLPFAERPRPLSDLLGGDPYYVGSVNRCSIGFSVFRGTQSGFVSSGHCGVAGNTTTGADRTDQGVFQASTFPASDFAWVSVNDGWTPRPSVKNGSGGTVSVAGSRAAVEGASVCRSGSATGWHCGTILQRNASVAYPQGNVFELIRTNTCAEPGDSGGSFVSGEQAQGVASGGSGDCTSGGITYYQPVNEILTTYGLSLVTTAGNPPQMSTGTCTGYPATATGTTNSGQAVYQPKSLYQSAVAGVHYGCLDADDGVDFDLYLERRVGSAWSTVATSNGSGADEKISYTGPAGSYRYRVVSASGSGPYTLGYRTP